MSDKATYQHLFDTSDQLSGDTLWRYAHTRMNSSEQRFVADYIENSPLKEMYLDVVEGYRNVDFGQLQPAVDQLHERIAARVEERPVKGLFTEYRSYAAAAAILIIIVGVLYLVDFSPEKAGMAGVEKENEKPVAELREKEEKVSEMPAETVVEEEESPAVEAPESPKNKEIAPEKAPVETKAVAVEDAAAAPAAGKAAPKPAEEVEITDNQLTIKGSRADAVEVYIDGEKAMDEAPEQTFSMQKNDPDRAGNAASGAVESTREKALKKESQNSTDSPAEFPGGEAALQAYIRGLHLPENSIKKDTTVRISFRILENGNVDKLKMLRGLDEKTDSIVIQYFTKMPAWKPQLVKGLPRSTFQELNIPVPAQ